MHRFVISLSSERILKYGVGMSKLLEEFQSSELNRNPVKVFTAAEIGPVLVTRRDGEDFVLMTEREAKANRSLVELASQLIAVATDDRGTLAERMAVQFPWMLALSETDRVTCAKELVDAARASFATGQVQMALIEITAWRETASAISEGLFEIPVDWLDEPIVVERPVPVS
jgi:hypothetical protein